MNILEKALKLRKSIPLKAKEPYFAFTNRIHWSYVICRIIEKSRNMSVVYEARRQLIITLGAAFEIYWRDFFKGFIDSHRLGERQLEKIREAKFSIGDIQKILGHKLTLGELISNIYVFQSPEVVNKLASEILGIDAFADFAKKKFKITFEIFSGRKTVDDKTEYIVLGSKVLSEIKHINHCFSIRHECVHDTGVRFRVSGKKLSQFQSAMTMFNVIFGMYLEGKITELSPKQK